MHLTAQGRSGDLAAIIAQGYDRYVEYAMVVLGWTRSEAHDAWLRLCRLQRERERKQQ